MRGHEVVDHLFSQINVHIDKLVLHIFVVFLSIETDRNWFLVYPGGVFGVFGSRSSQFNSAGRRRYLMNVFLIKQLFFHLLNLIYRHNCRFAWWLFKLIWRLSKFLVARLITLLKFILHFHFLCKSSLISRIRFGFITQRFKILSNGVLLLGHFVCQIWVLHGFC